jgi:hypothetical protein
MESRLVPTPSVAFASDSPLRRQENQNVLICFHGDIFWKIMIV